MPKTVKAYKGDEPYIFVSYSHADEALASAEFRRLQDNDYRVWYDEGISGGSRWTEDIARRLRGASLVVYLVTPNSAASENCANEIDYALDNHRPVLVVHLKPTDLPEGQKMALGGRQMIMRHQLTENEYVQKLFEAIAGRFGHETPDPVTQRRLFSRRSLTLAGSAVIAVILSIGLWFLSNNELGVSGPPELLPVLIADFDNQTTVALFDGTLESALEIGIEDAPFIDSYSRGDARKKLSALGYQLNDEGARLIAARESLKLVLVGKIVPDGKGYELTIRAVEPVSGIERIEVSADADSQLEVLEAVSSIARQVREQLGDVTVKTSALDETISARSLEAVAHYSKAQSLAADLRHQEAVVEYDRAIAIDNQFGRAYGGWAYSALVLGQTEQALALWDQTLTLLHTMTEREQLSAKGMYYANAVHNHEKAKETFAELVAKYPADARGANNLAMMYFLDRDFYKAIEAQAGLLKIYPERAIYRANFALFYMYAGNFEAAKIEAEQVLSSHPDYYLAHLPRAATALIAGNYSEALAAYDDMAAIGGHASNLADIGRIDLTLARGDYPRATKMLSGVIADGSSRSLMRERIWMASVQLRSGDLTGAKETVEAIEAIDASTMREEELLQFGEVLVALDRLDAASEIVVRLRKRLRDVPRAYADLLAAEIALNRGDHPAAIDHLDAALRRADMWLAHFVRGRVYLDADLLPEAMEEFALCLERQGEGFAIFLDDIPSYHRLVEAQYWLGRALQGVGQVQPAARAYQDYIAIRDLAATDPIVEDARRRIKDLVGR
jgi:tetratricopeptide (TPR) repeat protein